MSAQFNLTPPPTITLQEHATGYTITMRLLWQKQLRQFLHNYWFFGVPGLVMVYVLGMQWGYLDHDEVLWFSFMTIGLIFVAVFWLEKTIRRTQITLAGQTLTVSTRAILSSNQQFEVTKIEQVYCTRELKDGHSPAADYYLELSPVGRLKNPTPDPQQLAYLVGKLRHDLDLPNIPISGEYIPKALGKTYCKLSSYRGIIVHVLRLLIAIVIFWGIPYIAKIELHYLQELGILLPISIMVIDIFYHIWQAYRLNQDGQVIMGVITAKKYRTWSDSDNSKFSYYDVYYHYLEYEARFVTSEAVFNEVVVGQPIEVCYLSTKPDLSRPHPKEKYCDSLSD